MSNVEGNSSFSANIPGLQIAWDSTSLGTLKECPRKYYYSMILGRQPRAESVHLTFGQHYHAALERYDHAKSRGADFEEAQLEAVQYCLEATTVRLPGGGWRPWASDDPNKNRFTLLRSVVWYLEHFKEDPANTIQLANGKPAVELSFRFETTIEAPDGEHFVLCGHMDRVVELDESIYILDRKTTKNQISPSTFAAYNPDNQMSLYDFAGQVVLQQNYEVKGVIIDAAQVIATISRFQRGFVHKTPAHREEFYRNTRYWLEQAADFAESQYYPMNDKSCGNYGGCPFREVCAKSPATRDKWLMGLTSPRAWDPLKVRGDI